MESTWCWDTCAPMTSQLRGEVEVGHDFRECYRNVDHFSTKIHVRNQMKMFSEPVKVEIPRDNVREACRKI